MDDGRIEARHGPVELARQLGLVFLAALAYFAVRGLTESSVELASTHAHRVLSLERALGIDVEASLQAVVVDRHWLATLANWVYIWGHWPVIGATLLWLHRRHRPAYRLLRNALFVSGAIGLVIFAAFPVAPPRLAGIGMADTVTELSRSYRVLQPPALVNKYAAVPSLHVGWNLLVGIFIARYASRPAVRWFGRISPALMVLAVVVTGNHYVLDAVAGAAVAGLGLFIAHRAHAVRQRRNGATAPLHRERIAERVPVPAGPELAALLDGWDRPVPVGARHGDRGGRGGRVLDLADDRRADRAGRLGEGREHDEHGAAHEQRRDGELLGLAAPQQAGRA